LPARQDQAQRDERQIRRPITERLERAIKRLRRCCAHAPGENRLRNRPLIAAAVEKIRVELLELHGMRFAGKVALLCTLAVFTLGASSRPIAPAFLSRMRVAAGPVYGAHLVSITRGRTRDALAIRTDSHGSRFTTSQCPGTICFGTHLACLRLYSINMNGTALPRSDQLDLELRGVRTVLSGAFLHPSFERDGGSIADGGPVVVHGERYQRLFVQNVDALPMEVYVDPGTALVRALRDVNGDAAFVLRDYRKVGGLTLPFAIERAGGGAIAYASQRTSPDPFTAPQGLRPQVVSSAALSIDPQSDAPVGECTLDGTPARCLIDTGNSGLSISLELAERLGLQPIGAFEVSGLGTYATEVVRAGPLLIGGLQFPEANYAVLNDIHRYGYDMVLGADILATSQVAIDYANHTVSFTPSGDAPTDHLTVPLAFENFIPVVPVKLDSVESLLALDTGDESTINLAYDYYSQHNDLFTPTASTGVSGVGGDSVELMGRISDVQIGAFHVLSQHIGTTRVLHGTADGHLGAGFLRHFRVVLDYAKGRLWLDPRPGDPAVQLAK